MGLLNQWFRLFVAAARSDEKSQAGRDNIEIKLTDLQEYLEQ
jgi:hypothetical protein